MTDVQSDAGFNPHNHDGYGVSLPGEPGYRPPDAGMSTSRPVGPSVPRSGIHRVEPAGIFSRWVGSFIDGLVVAVAPFTVLIGGAISLPKSPSTCTTQDPFTGTITTSHCEVIDPGLMMGLIVMFGIVYLIAMLFVVVAPIGSRGQSIGMRVMGIQVIDANGLQAIGFGRSLIRAAVAMFFSGIFSLGFIWAIFDRRNQTWHDKAANSIVVRKV